MVAKVAGILLLSVNAVTTGVEAKTDPVPPAGPTPVAEFDSKPVIVLLPDGKLMAFFMRARESSGKPDAVPVQTATASVSADGGRSFGNERTLFELPTEPGGWGGLEVLVDRHGEIHLIFLNDAYTGIIHTRKAEHPRPWRQSRLDIWHVKSTDVRTRWQKPKRVWEGYTGALNSFEELRSGRLVLPFSYLTPRTWRDRGEGLDTFTFRGQFDCTVISSDDRGETWQLSPSSLRVTTPDDGHTPTDTIKCSGLYLLLGTYEKYFSSGLLSAWAGLLY